MAFPFDFDQGRLVEICRRWQVRRLTAFGSALRSDFSEASDIDLIVEFHPGAAPGLGFITLENELSQVFGRKVDLNTAEGLARSPISGVLDESEELYVAA